MDFLIRPGLVDLLMDVEGVLPGREGICSSIPGVTLLVPNRLVVVIATVCQGEINSLVVATVVVVLAGHEDQWVLMNLLWSLNLEKDGKA